MILKERIFYIFLISGAFVLAFKLSFKVDYFSNNKKKQFWIKKTYELYAYNIVILGDSRVYRGVNPSAFEKIMPNYKTVNFAYSSAGLSRFLLHRATSKFKGKKNILLIGLTPFSLCAESTKNEQLQIIMSGKKEEIIEALYFKNFINYFEAFDPQFIINARYTSEKRSKEDSTYYHEIYHDNGWIESWIKYCNFSATLASYSSGFERTRFDSVEVYRSINLISNLIKRGVKVFAFRPPVYSQLLQLEEEKLGKEYLKVKTELIKNKVVWLDLPEVTNGTYDGSHLKSGAAKIYSNKLALLLKKELSN